jgi:hypothetical protein
VALALGVAKAGPDPEVVLEATYGWYWATHLLSAEGAQVHLAHPLGNNWGQHRVKNDERDASDLVDLLRLVHRIASHTCVVPLLSRCPGGEPKMPYSAAPIMLEEATKAELERRVRATTSPQREN